MEKTVGIHMKMEGRSHTTFLFLFPLPCFILSDHLKAFYRQSLIK